MTTGPFAKSACRFLCPLALVVLAGCHATIYNHEVAVDDTQQRWDRELARVPFVFHSLDGRVESFSAAGDTRPVQAGQVNGRTSERVEIFVTNHSGKPAPLCADAPPMAGSVQTSRRIHVEAELCDGPRPVVSFTDRVLPGLFADRPAYIARARHLLITGIWSSPAQEPPSTYDPFNDE